MAIVVKALSFSTVNQFVNCPQRVIYEKVDHLPKRQGMSSKALFGVSLHSAVAAFFRGLLNNVKMDLDQLVRVFRIKLCSWPAKDVVNGDQSVDALCNEAKALLEQFLASNPPTNIIGIEKPIRYALTSVLDCVGQIDLLVRDGDGVLNVIDVKSTSKAPADDQIRKYEEQCYVYALNYAEPVRAKAWMFLRRKKNPEFQVVDLNIDKIDQREIVDKFTGVAAAITNGRIHFKNRSYQCGSCPYSYMCISQPVEAEHDYQEAA